MKETGCTLRIGASEPNATDAAIKYNGFLELSERTALILFQTPDERDSDIVVARVRREL